MILGGTSLFGGSGSVVGTLFGALLIGLINNGLILAGLDSSLYGTHSMRRTKVAQIYRKTGNLRAVQLLLGHTKLESTVRYLGIEVDDALSISEQVEI